ncbi:N-acetyltransferase [Bacillus sp. J14TS2]|uniref:GNAT family N-acetyltransferase n=1 Tax=Bacillus sp. J14TS2 TaxID=2807188 RepID=UPI001B0A9E78|nr:N-acetyltransferase [Bacillus sp. J14TS2]GIN72787.1 N-acetyltransferase [Bacillus sp. J14TS2]
MDILIRQEITSDYDKTEEIIQQAFLNEEKSDQTEHILVRQLRTSAAFIPELSLIAVDQDNEIVGHILLTKIKIVDGDHTADSLALAPVSVFPEHQKQGIGSELIHTALKKAKEMDKCSVIVLGHKDFYPRFGFKPAKLWKIRAPFEVPDEVFMALELTENALANVQGVVQYSQPFLE